MELKPIDLAPSTFEERGSAIAFTTPILAQTRVRKDERERLEVLIPSFSGGKGIYVIPWRALPEVVPMTVHDRCLHDLIGRQTVCTPLGVRRASLHVARSGLAGPQAARAARHALEEDAAQRTLTNYLLILRLLAAVGLDADDALSIGADTEEGERVTRTLMHKAALGLGLSPAELYSRVARLAEALSPIGLNTAPKPGRLRRRLVLVNGFRAAIGRWSKGEGEEVQRVANFCAATAAETHALGTAVLAQVDGRTANMDRIIANWEREMLHLQHAALRLTWLLDGWDFVATAWADALDRPHAQQLAALDDIFRVLPLPPTRETRADLYSQRERVAASRQYVAKAAASRANDDWRNRDLDVDQVQRIEQLNARAAA